MTLRLSAGWLVLLAGAIPLAAQQEPRIDSLFSAWQHTDGPGCIAGVKHNGSLIHLKAYGMANLEYGIPLTPESVSESGSVAKQFTAAVLLLLAREGKLSLDDDVRKYVPEIPDFGARLTLRHFLTHTSGIRDQWALLALAGWPPGTQVHSVDQIVHLISRQRRLNFAPGELYLYSNTGYTLLAAVVKKVTGQSLADWSREHLFRPLGMGDTQWRDDYRRVVQSRATAYSRGPGNAWMQDMPFTMVYGNGGLLTTVPDLLRWNDALSEGTAPLSPELVQELETPMRLNDGTVIDYALGLGVGSSRGLRTVAHGGSTAGYRTQLSRWPERGLSVAILCNAANANPGAYAQQIAQRVLQLPGEETPPAPAAPIAAAELAGLAGTWRDTLWDQSMTFTVQDGRLMGSTGMRPGGQATPIMHLGNLRFWSPAAGELHFERTGSTWRLVQQQNGRHEYVRQTPVDASSVRLVDFTGRYRSEELEVTYDIGALGERLTLKRAWASPVPLQPIYTDGFSVQGRTIRFMRDASGRVTGFRVFAGRALDVRFARLSETE